MTSDPTPCLKCNLSTVSVRKRRAHFVCELCGHDKTLSDVYYYEAIHGREHGE